jgi:hypothetical protein
MKAKEINANGASIMLSQEELLIVSNALNEICNGLDLPEFATRIGAERESAARLLQDIGDVYDKVAKQSTETPAAV